MSTLSSTMLDRVHHRSRLPYHWLVILTAVILYLLPIISAILDRDLVGFFSGDPWYIPFLAPSIVVYILVVYPAQKRGQLNVIAAFRPLISLNDEDYHKMVRSASALKSKDEWLVFAAGNMFFLLMSQPWSTIDSFSWLALSMTLTSGLMFGLLGWVIYSVLSGTRLMAALHNHVQNVDIFDHRPFEPIGWHSLLTVIVFIGGCTISLLFLVTPDNILQPSNLFVNGTLVLVAIIFFFLNQRHTHRLLIRAKKQELDTLLQDYADTYRRYSLARKEGADTRRILNELSALAQFEHRLKETRTWPYNTGMLRTLFFSVLIPTAFGAARVAAMFIIG